MRAVDLSPKERIELTLESRKTLAQFLGGFLLLAGLYFTWQTVESTYQSVRLSQEGQVTDRYYRAIQQLGSRRMEARLGAIYALERIIHESPRDAWPILQVLSAYIREQAHWSPERAAVLPESQPDIQAVLDIIRESRAEIRGSVNLGGSDLRKADLTDVKLIGVNLDGARLDGASLISADLTGSSMVGVSLRNAYLSLPKEGPPRGARLPRKLIRSFSFGMPLAARLQFVLLINADLRGARLQSVDLKSAKLNCADLRNADLSNADLTGVDLTFADLRRTNLRGALVWSKRC